MFTSTEPSRRTQRLACLLMSVCIVVSTLAVGAHGIDSMAHPGYTVTITQLQ